MSCSEGLARIFVFVANFAFLLVGLALLIVGILYKVNLTKYTDAIPDDYAAIQNVPTFAIIVGVIIFVIAFLGCCGALKSNTCMLSWYGGILIVIFLIQIGLGIFAFVQIKNRDDFDSKFSTQLGKLFDKYTSSSHEVVDLIQQNFKCCGTTGPTYWNNAIPASCYPDKTTTNQYFTQGCNTVMIDFLWSSMKVIAIVAIAISVTEVIGAVLALCLSGCIRERRRQGAYY